MDVAALALLLHETAEQHDPYEKASAKHDWWDWYAIFSNSCDGLRHRAFRGQAPATDVGRGACGRDSGDTSDMR